MCLMVVEGMKGASVRCWRESSCLTTPSVPYDKTNECLLVMGTGEFEADRWKGARGLTHGLGLRLKQFLILSSPPTPNHVGAVG